MVYDCFNHINRDNYFSNQYNRIEVYFFMAYMGEERHAIDGLSIPILFRAIDI